MAGDSNQRGIAFLHHLSQRVPQGWSGHRCTACTVAFTQTASSPWVRHEGPKENSCQGPSLGCRSSCEPSSSQPARLLLLWLCRFADALLCRWPGGPESSTRPSDNGLEETSKRRRRPRTASKTRATLEGSRLRADCTEVLHCLACDHEALKTSS